ncbi:phosphoribulokinase/uridine kinase [Clostridium sp. CAG:798]|jgi:AAA ATPase|nr:phosphoribulokinase/uridine kinase [Clostridium sp. CAG:798]HBJ12036.1 AAA family ATPase [Clostridiales bacterium]
MKIVYKSQKNLEIENRQKVIDIFKEEIKNSENNIIACKCNNEVKSLNYEVEPEDKVELIDTTTRDGRRVYIRGLLYIMAKALYELYPKALLTVNYQLSNSMLCEIENMEITEEFIKKLSEKMNDIVKKDLEIKKIEMTKEEAIKFYEKEKTLRGILQLENKEKDEVSLYFCEEYYNYFYGVMPVSTGYIKKFEVIKYHDGFLLRYPSKNSPNALDDYHETKKLLNTLDEYEDIHKTLGIGTVYKLNKAISEGKAQDIISLAEALHEKKISDIADKIIERKNVKAILIAGPSSSGKTTFAKRLGIQLRLNGLKPVTISVDNYFVERKDNPKHSDGTYDFECIEAIDLKLFNEHLTKLLNGEEIDVPTFNFKTGNKEYHGEKMKLADDEVLVMEGIHCLNDKLTESIPKEQKYKIYISALTVLNIDYYNRISTTDTRLIRRIVRDYQFRSYSALHTLQTWLSVNKGEEKYIYPFQEEADSMFNTSLIYELCVLKKHAHPLLKEITNVSKEFSEAKNLYNLLNYFEDIPDELVPRNSLLREFIGGSIFEQ